MIYKDIRNYNTSIECNDSVEGESIEVKVRRIVENKEPITDGAPPIYTDRKEGVKEAYNIRTDRWDIAVNAMDAVSRSKTAKRDNIVKLEPKVEPKNEPKNGGTPVNTGD